MQNCKVSFGSHFYKWTSKVVNANVADNMSVTFKVT
jgi:hypothetical protein